MQSKKKPLNDIEYQALSYLKEAVWKKVLPGIGQAWTIKNAELIAESVQKITGLDTQAKAISKLGNLTQMEGIAANNTTIHKLCMFISEQRSALDTTLWRKLVLLFETNEIEKSIELNVNDIVYTGNYTMHYRSIATGERRHNRKLMIQENGTAIFEDNAQTYHGEYYSLKSNPNLFFIFRTQTEYFFMIVILGSTYNKNYLSYIGGLLTATRGRPTDAYSLYVLLVKEDMETVDYERIDAYFDAIGDNYKIILGEKFLNITNLANTMESLMTTAQKRLLDAFKGNWYIYVYYEANSCQVLRAKLEIKGLNQLKLSSPFNEYRFGSIKGEQNDTIILLELKNERCHVSFIFNIGNSGILNLNFTKALCSTTGALRPFTGYAIFERVE
ncbi:MAG: hypothetical protein RLZZ628_2310, partial [Bacteroidota bacterium]